MPPVDDRDVTRALLRVQRYVKPITKDREKRLVNDASKHMAKNMARNLVYYAQLLKKHPLEPAVAAVH